MAIKPQSSKARYKKAKTLRDYFDQRVIKHSEYYDADCWRFSTAGDKDGYPQVTGSKHCNELGLTRAHQVSYFLYHGDIPEGYFVCHKCDNPSCVNPYHLYLGTPNDNVQDMVRKNRNVHPTTVGKGYKCSLEQREQINSLKGKLPCTVVGPMFNMSFSNVARMWRQIDTPICKK